jgi:hypothetical protein
VSLPPLCPHLVRSDEGTTYCDLAERTVRNLEAGLAQRELDTEEYATLTDRLSLLLRETANALKGPPAPLHMHDWSDLPGVASLTVARVKSLEAAVLALWAEMPAPEVAILAQEQPNLIVLCRELHDQEHPG